MTEPYYNVSQIELEEDEKEDLESDEDFDNIFDESALFDDDFDDE